MAMAPEEDAIAGGRMAFANYGLHDLIRVVTKRRKWIVGSAIGCVLAAVMLSWAMRPVYEATATIELNKNAGASLDLDIGDLLGGQLSGGSDLQTDLQTESLILQGDSLALAVIEDLHLAAQEPFAVKLGKDTEAGLPLERSPQRRTRLLRAFKSHLKVTSIHGTRLIRVTFSSHDPQQAATIANTLIDSYKAQYMQSHYNASSEASNWLAKQLADLKTNVEESEKKLTDFEKEYGVLNLPTLDGNTPGSNGLHSAVIQKLDMLNTELTTAEANRIVKEAIYRLVSSGSEDAILGISQNSMGLDATGPQGAASSLAQSGRIATLQQLRQQKSQTKIALAQAANTYGPNNRHLIELKAQEAAIETQIRSEIQEIVRSANSDYQLAKQTEAVMHRQFDQQQAEASHLNEKAVELAVLSQEAASRKKLYEDLYSKLQEANVSAGIKATNITVVDPARVQSSPVQPKPVLNCGVGFLVGLFLGVGLAYLVDSLDNRVMSLEEVEETTSLPVIGLIPSFGAGAKRSAYAAAASELQSALTRAKTTQTNDPDADSNTQAWILKHPESAAAEAIRAVRTAIMLSRPNGGPCVILVTSCMPGEGKSTLSANIAISYAQHGKTVVIVEADMRRPSMKHVLNVTSDRGLSNVLSGTAIAGQVILHNVSLTGLDVLPAGPRPPLPSELLGAESFDKLLEELRHNYDVVIVDSPPALLLTDAVSIAAKTDAVVWVAMAGTITRPQLIRATQLIERSSMPMIGFVLNRADRVGGSYEYGYDYGYGYSYGYYGSCEGEDVNHA